MRLVREGALGDPAPVLLEVLVTAERAVTVLADEGPLAGVDAHMVVQVCLIVGRVGAVRALEAVPVRRLEVALVHRQLLLPQ